MEHHKQINGEYFYYNKNNIEDGKSNNPKEKVETNLKTLHYNPPPPFLESFSCFVFISPPPFQQHPQL